MKVRARSASVACCGLARRHHGQAAGFEDQIVRMHMFARRDVLRGAADRLGVFHHGFTGGDRLDRHLVAGLDRFSGDRAARQHGADLYAAIGNGDIVGG